MDVESAKVYSTHGKCIFDLFFPSSCALLVWLWISWSSHYSEFMYFICNYCMRLIKYMFVIFSTGINEQGTTTHPHILGLSRDLYLLVMIKSTGLVGNLSVQTEMVRMVRVQMTRSTVVQTKGQPGWGTMMSVNMVTTTVLARRENLSLCARKLMLGMMTIIYRGLRLSPATGPELAPLHTGISVLGFTNLMIISCFKLWGLNNCFLSVVSFLTYRRY